MDQFPLDATKTYNSPDLSTAVDAHIGVDSGVDAIESKLALWYDASNTNLLNNAGINNGASVSEWKELEEGNGHHMTQSTSKQATLTKNGMNGLDTMTYTNTNLTNYTPINVGETVHTFFFVYHPSESISNNGTGSNGPARGAISFNSSNQELWLGNVTSYLDYEVLSFNSGMPMDSYHGSSESISAQPHIFAVRYHNNKNDHLRGW